MLCRPLSIGIRFGLTIKNLPLIVIQNDSLVDSTDLGDDIWRRTGGIRYI